MELYKMNQIHIKSAENVEIDPNSTNELDLDGIVQNELDSHKTCRKC